MSVIDEVKQRTEIVEVVSQYTSLTKAGRTMKGLCPFHSEKHGSFFVYPEQQSWHCFGACNTGGDVFSFVMKKENLDFSEALRQLAGRAGVALPSRQAPADRDKRDRLFQANAAAAFYVGGHARSLEDGVHQAESSIDRGSAWDVVLRLSEATRAARSAQTVREAEESCAARKPGMGGR